MKFSFKSHCYLLIIFLFLFPMVNSACTIASGISCNGHVWNANNEDGPGGIATFINVFPKNEDSKFGYYTLSYFSPKNGEGGGIQGGMNEAGLTFDFNAIDPVHDSNLKNKKAFPEGDGAILPHILANLSTVQEVIELFDTYWFQNGFNSAQMHVADRHGRFALISPSGSLLVEEGQPLVSTNFDICGGENGSTCWRYPIAMSKLNNSCADFSIMENIVRDTKNESTLYSNVQNLSTGDIWFYKDPLGKGVKINLSDLLGKGQKSYQFDDLQSLVEDRPAYFQSQLNSVDVTPEILNSYSGDYYNSYTDSIEVSIQENGIGIPLGEGSPKVFYPKTENEYYLPDSDYRVKFQIDSSDYKMVMTFYENEFWSFKATKDLTVEMLEQIIEEKPGSASAHLAMAKAQGSKGNDKASLAFYKSSLELDPENQEAVRNIQWIQESLNAQNKPVTVPAEVLASYEGQYDVRKVTFRDGNLYYSRDGNPENLLIPLSQEIFALETSDTFRLRFLRVGDGLAKKVIGIYRDGRTDESERDKF